MMSHMKKIKESKETIAESVFDGIPDDCIAEIFSWLGRSTITRMECALVCRRWARVLDTFPTSWANVVFMCPRNNMNKFKKARICTAPESTVNATLFTAYDIAVMFGPTAPSYHNVSSVSLLFSMDTKRAVEFVIPAFTSAKRMAIIRIVSGWTTASKSPNDWYDTDFPLPASVRTLNLNGCDMALARVTLSNVRRLSLDNLTITMEGLACFPNLEVLRITHCAAIVSSADHNSTPTLPCLHKLVIGMFYNRPPYWDLLQAVMSTVRHLIVLDGSDVALSKLPYSPNLRKMDLCLTDASNVKFINSTKTPTLRTLKLHRVNNWNVFPSMLNNSTVEKFVLCGFEGAMDFDKPPVVVTTPNCTHCIAKTY